MTMSVQCQRATRLGNCQVWNVWKYLEYGLTFLHRFIATDEAHVSGWGLNQLEKASRDLRVAQVPILDIRSCTEQLVNAGLTINEHVLCTGGGGWTACESDSGGPLTYARNGTDGEEERYLCGIVSWRFSCQTNERGLPDVYTDVSKYERWI